MAIHTFVCDECSVSVQDTNCKGVHVCPRCGSDMRWDLRFHAHGDCYSRPIHSDALAISPLQRAEHERRFPYIQLDNECRPIFDNFSSHQKYLKECGFHKERQKLKPKGVKLSK
jgi:hypothetical protein